MIETLPHRPDLSVAAILGYSFLTFAIGIVLSPWFLTFLRKNRLGKQLRVETVDGREPSIFKKYHQHKFGTPTMGGLLIWGSIFITIAASRLLSLSGAVESSLLQRGQVYLPLFALLSFGILGAVDDYFNICGIGKKKGLDWLPKLSFLVLISLLGALWFYIMLGHNAISIPFVPEKLEVGWMYIPIFMFIVIGTANAVNVTDGLDGLAGGLLIVAFGAFGVLAYLKGLYVLSGFCGVCVGAIAAFLWNNVPPALFYMGDTGSLALGGTLAVIAMMIDQVLVLPLIGAVFVLEMLSVIIQLTSKKLRGGKKVFKAAPIHHHFEALDWGESKVTMRLWIIGVFFAFLGVIIGILG